MHVVIYFCGTGDPGVTFYQKNSADYLLNNPQVKTIVVKGCEQPEVCNSGLFPNLQAFAERFVGAIFKKPDNQTTPSLRFKDKVQDKDYLASVGVKQHQ